mgnify:CR=1 FL=1
MEDKIKDILSRETLFKLNSISVINSVRSLSLTSLAINNKPPLDFELLFIR